MPNGNKATDLSPLEERIDSEAAEAVKVLAIGHLITERTAVRTLRDLGCDENEIDRSDSDCVRGEKSCLNFSTPSTRCPRAPFGALAASSPKCSRTARKASKGVPEGVG